MRNILNTRTLAAAFWISYFTLHWLLTLEVVEMNLRAGIVLVTHFSLAGALSINIAATDFRGKKNDS